MHDRVHFFFYNFFLIFDEVPISTVGKERTNLLHIYHVLTTIPAAIFALTCLTFTTILQDITYLQYRNEKTLAQSLIKPVLVYIDIVME